MFWNVVCFGLFNIFVLFCVLEGVLLRFFCLGWLFVFEGFCLLDLFLLFRCHVVTVT